MYHLKYEINMDILSHCCYTASKLYLPLYEPVKQHKPRQWKFAKPHINEAWRRISVSFSYTSRHIASPSVDVIHRKGKKYRHRRYRLSRYMLPFGSMLDFAKRYLKHPLRINKIKTDPSGIWVFDLTFHSMEDMVVFKVGFTP